jgi:hypothetical protein
MARPRVLLVGGNPPMAEMLTDYFHHDDRYEIESVTATMLWQCSNVDGST